MKQYTDSDKLFRSDMLRRYPGRNTRIYREYAYDPDVEDAFHSSGEIDEYYAKLHAKGEAYFRLECYWSSVKHSLELKKHPGKHTKIYRDYAYDPDVEGAFHTAEEIDEYLKDYIEEAIASCTTEE